MYRRAYGGHDQAGGIENMPEPDAADPYLASLGKLGIKDSTENMHEDGDSAEGEVMDIGLALTSSTPAEEPVLPQPPEPKPPLLRLQTDFLVKPKAIRIEPVSAGGARSDPKLPVEKAGNAEEDGDRTARPAEELPIMFRPWGGGSIGEILSAEALSPQRCSMRMGPTTPNGYDDISPITRGEWGFLMVDDQFQGAKTVRVETC